MAATTTSLQALHQHFLSHSPNPPPPNKPSLTLSLHHSPQPPPLSSLSLTSRTTAATTATTAFSVLTPAATTSTAPSFDALARHLSSADFRRADEETRRLLISLAGDAAQARGYVFFSEVRFIDPADLRAIDALWRDHSGGRFGYSVQKKIWERKSGRDFTRFFIRVGWMKKLDTEVEQWNYRSFPAEFIWELNDDTPEGHLPLTNALRGTQLLASILTHPAFDDPDDEAVESSDEEDEEEKKAERPKLLGGKIGLKTDYSF